MVVRLLTHTDADLSTFFDIVDKTRDKNFNTSLQLLFFNNHTNDDNKGNIRIQFFLEHIIGFCKKLRKNKWPWS